MSLFLQQTRGVCKIFDLSKIPEDVRLFDGIEGSELADLLDCMGARVVSYAREQFVFLAGDPVSGMGIVCSGSVQEIGRAHVLNSSHPAGSRMPSSA